MFLSNINNFINNKIERSINQIYTERLMNDILRTIDVM